MANVPNKPTFSDWLARFQLADKQSKFWDIFIKFLGIIGGVGAFIWGIWQFKTNSERDFKKEFYNEQMKAMSQTVDVTSTLAAYPDSSAKFKQAVFEFDKVRSGQLTLFSDRKLDGLVGRFYTDLNVYLTHDGSVNKGQLKAESDAIAVYCKDRIIDLTKL